MTRIAAIDITPTNAHFLVVEQSFRKISLLTAETLRRGGDEDVSQFWARVYEALPEGIDAMVCSGDAKHSATRISHFPFGDTKKVEAALEFQLESDIPYDISDVNIAWCTVEKPAVARMF
uniref:Uncharacterized protein n=1 Tax=uncultured marine bacterium MedDCM-OCT-S01-C143 TaxID=743046 RepID=D6PCC6_9BACT|nr:hypothetical protein [uncultured marine bacterium MedDCM-OCT-S01-C143]